MQEKQGYLSGLPSNVRPAVTPQMTDGDGNKLAFVERDVSLWKDFVLRADAGTYSVDFPFPVAPPPPTLRKDPKRWWGPPEEVSGRCLAA